MPDRTEIDLNELDVEDFESILRLPDIIGDPKAQPPIKPIIPVSKSAWWAGCRSGRYPKPVKIGPNTTGWWARDIRALLASFKDQA